jgi:sec-independent protein translocase protein TatA
MFGMGVGEIVIILVIALIFIGPKKLPQIARGLGKGLREFQNAASGIKDAINNPQPTQEQQTPPNAIEQNESTEEKPEPKFAEDDTLDEDYQPNLDADPEAHNPDYDDSLDNEEEDPSAKS